MRCLTHITLVTVIQFIACYLAGWGMPKQFYAVLHSTGRDCLYGCSLKYEKTECVG